MMGVCGNAPLVAGALCALARFAMAHVDLLRVVGEARGRGKVVETRRCRLAPLALTGAAVAAALGGACLAGMLSR